MGTQSNREFFRSSNQITDYCFGSHVIILFHMYKNGY